MADTQLTWLGHASFRFDSPGGKRVYVDPFLNGNPKTPDNEKEPERVDIIAITHGHGDHVGDTVDIWKTAQAGRHRSGRAPRSAGLEAWDRRGERPRPQQGRHRRGRGHQVLAHRCKPLELDLARRGSRLLRRACRLRDRGRERDEDLLRRRHERLRRHAADQAAVRARRRRPADRRPLHHGSARGGGRARVPRREAVCSRATGVRSPR